jgi:transposase
LFRALGVDPTLIEGINVGTALVILAEIGVDLDRVPTEKHFASWLRCPPQDQSNKTQKRRGHRKGTNRVAIALRMAARSAGKSLSPLSQFYRRIRSRIGGLGAVKATAHKLACFAYRMLKYGQEYVTQSMEEYEARMKANLLNTLKRGAAAMGFQLSPLPHELASEERPSPSRDRPVTTRNAEGPTSRASVSDAGGLGEVRASWRRKSTKNARRSNQCR